MHATASRVLESIWILGCICPIVNDRFFLSQMLLARSSPMVCFSLEMHDAVTVSKVSRISL